MNTLFILRLHSKEVDECFIIFNNSYPKALYTDRHKLENDYGKLWDFSIKTTKAEIKTKIAKLPDSIQETMNIKYM